MSTQNVGEVVRLETLNPAFRLAFRANADQALTLFAKDLHLDGSSPLTRDEVNGILSITDDEFKAFSHIGSIIGLSFGNPVTKECTQAFL